jgi:transketolase
MFLNHLYGGMDEPEVKIIDVFICKLRKKIEKIMPDGGGCIETVWGRGYVLRDPAGGPPEVILMGTGSEVHIALAAQALLADQGVLARVVSLPCWELFAAQPQAYRDSVLPPEITARVAIEAGVTLGWERWLGPAGVAIGLNHFGASAPYETLYEKFGLTPEAVAAAARQLHQLAIGS